MELPFLSPRRVFGRLNDRRWFEVLARSINESVIRGVRLPGFPAPEMQSLTVGSAGRGTLKEALNFYTHVKNVCAKHGRPIRPGSEILDFGVSWGRIIRFFLKDVDAETLHGVDTSPEFLGAAKDTGVPGHLHLIDPLGRLPYDSGSFDLVYAYSVFTHLPERVQDHWLLEIQRVLKPGGIFVATVEPPRFLDFFMGLNTADPSLHPWHATTAKKIQSEPSLNLRLQTDGFIFFVPEGDPAVAVYGDCVMTATYAMEHWGTYFEILEWLDDSSRFWQAVLVGRNRAT
jgi:SAM-dependent methyltransferase